MPMVAVVVSLTFVVIFVMPVLIAVVIVIRSIAIIGTIPGRTVEVLVTYVSAVFDRLGLIVTAGGRLRSLL